MTSVANKLASRDSTFVGGGSDPKLSVVVPFYNPQPYFREAIDSLLCQSFPDFELILINDGSTDDSEAMLDGFDDPRIRLIRNETNLGIAPSMNRALEVARAPLVARQDADDASLPNRFAEQVRFLRNNPDIVMVGTAMDVVDAEGRVITRWSYGTEPDVCRWHALSRSPVGNTSTMFRRDAVLSVGGYDVRFQPADDYDLWGRLLDVGGITNLPQSLVRYRVHETAVTTTQQPKLDNLGCQISRRLLSRYLADSCVETMLEVTRNSSPGVPLVCTAIECYNRLERQFIRQHNPSVEAADEIHRNLLHRVVDHARHLSLGDRYLVYRSMRRGLSSSFRDQLAARMLMPPGVKDAIKRMAGREVNSHVTRDSADGQSLSARAG